MPILECPEVFELVLPDGFRVFGEPGRYDIEPPEGMDLGLNISVYSPVSSEMQSEGATDLLTDFVGWIRGDVEDLQIANPPGDGQRAFTFFNAEERDWFAGFLLLPGGAVLATANTASGNEALHLGKRLIASIYPIKPRRRLFGRR